MALCTVRPGSRVYFKSHRFCVVSNSKHNQVIRVHRVIAERTFTELPSNQFTLNAPCTVRHLASKLVVSQEFGPPPALSGLDFLQQSRKMERLCRVACAGVRIA